MQMICGVHYNFSFSNELFEFLFQNKLYAQGLEKQEFINSIYFHVSRNFLRNYWILVYLFGASPIADKSYEDVIKKQLGILETELHAYDFIEYSESYATSLRMSRFGYTNIFQGLPLISYDSLDDYIEDLESLMMTNSDRYESLGLFKNGEPIQLNANILQIENEYYSPLRLKGKLEEGEESHLAALKRGGVQHMELRVFDLNPFEKAGVNLDQLYFTHVFILYCLFQSSLNLTQSDEICMQRNYQKISLKGRKDNLNLCKTCSNSSLLEWADEMFMCMREIAIELDKESGDTVYSQSIEVQYKKLKNKDLLPSSRMMNL